MLLQIFCMQFVFVEVYTVCDRMNGPSGLTDCVHSPSYSEFQAAICLRKDKMKVTTPSHISCKWKDAKYCWYLCSTTPSNGGLSACKCDPKSNSQKTSETSFIDCYFPSGNCSWFSKCLAKTENCPLVWETENKCKEWDNIAKKMYEKGRSWINAVKSCIQESLVHMLYPQVFNDCEKISSKLEWATTTCFLEPHNEFRYCDLAWGDIFKMDGVFKGFYKWLKHCKRTPIIPPWAKLLVFYLENKTGKDTDVLANETGKTLSQSFKWKETGLSYKSIGPDIFKELSSSIPIHVHLYSETEDYQKIKLAVNNLKEYLANRTALLITLSDGTNIKVNNVVSCSDPQCLIYDLFPFQTDDPSCNAYDGKCQSDTTQCKGGSYIPAHCYENSTHKCCLPTPRDQDTGDCKDLDLPILSRDTWGAARPDLISNMSLPVTKFFLHHTETGNCQDTKSCSKLLQSIQRYHIGKGWHDIAYNFLIAGSGQTFEGRGWNRIGTHTKNYNDIALAASFIGNFNNTMPSKPALMSARKLLECAVYRKVIIPSYKLYGHYDVTTKDSECPGYTLYNAIRKWSHYQINADKDKPCLRKGGRCWPNYIPCNGTYYESLCEGNSQRQCCIPPFT